MLKAEALYAPRRGAGGLIHLLMLDRHINDLPARFGSPFHAINCQIYGSEPDLWASLTVRKEGTLELWGPELDSNQRSS